MQNNVSDKHNSLYGSASSMDNTLSSFFGCISFMTPVSVSSVMFISVLTVLPPSTAPFQGLSGGDAGQKDGFSFRHSQNSLTDAQRKVSESEC